MDAINPNNTEDVDAFHKLLEAYVDTDHTLSELLTILSRRAFKTLEQAETILKNEVS